MTGFNVPPQMQQAKEQAAQKQLARKLRNLLVGLTRQLGMRHTPTQFILDLNTTIV
jgi:hypothetical protein